MSFEGSNNFVGNLEVVFIALKTGIFTKLQNFLSIDIAQNEEIL